MTELDYNYQIENNRQAVLAYQREIKQFNSEIEELKQFEGKINSSKEGLHNTVSKTSGIVENMKFVCGLVTTVAKGNFFLRVLETVKGESYTSAIRGLDVSAERVRAEINRLQRIIEEKYWAINRCNANIQTLQAQKAAFLAAEAQKMEGAQ